MRIAPIIITAHAIPGLIDVNHFKTKPVINIKKPSIFILTILHVFLYYNSGKRIGATNKPKTTNLMLNHDKCFNQY